MNFRFYFIGFILLLFAATNIHSQNVIYTNEEEIIQPSEENNTDYLQNDENQNTSKVNYNVNVGTSVTSSKFGNAVSLYTAPEIRYRLAPKLSISTGFLITNTTISGYYAEEKERQSNFTNTYVYTGIDYYANERLRISGEILYGINQPKYSVFGNNSSSDYYLRFSAEYKITKSLSVGVQIINHNMGYPGYNDPFYRNPFDNYYNPYHPFSRF
jgi:hypothetical protein